MGWNLDIHYKFRNWHFLWECDNCSLHLRSWSSLTIGGNSCETQILACLSSCLVSGWSLYPETLCFPWSLPPAKEELLAHLPESQTVNKENREWICEVTSQLGIWNNFGIWKNQTFCGWRKDQLTCMHKRPSAQEHGLQLTKAHSLTCWPWWLVSGEEVTFWQISHSIFAFFFFSHCRTFVKTFLIMLSKSMPSSRLSSPWSCCPILSMWLWTSMQCSSSGTSSGSRCWFCGSAFCKVCRTPMATTPGRRTFCKLSPKRQPR